MIAPSASVFSSIVVMNIAGVVQSPQSNTSLSAAVMPRISAAFSLGPEFRESRPTAIFNLSGVVNWRFASHTANA